MRCSDPTKKTRSAAGTGRTLVVVFDGDWLSADAQAAVRRKIQREPGWKEMIKRARAHGNTPTLQLTYRADEGVVDISLRGAGAGASCGLVDVRRFLQDRNRRLETKQQAVDAKRALERHYQECAEIRERSWKRGWEEELARREAQRRPAASTVSGPPKEPNRARPGAPELKVTAPSPPSKGAWVEVYTDKDGNTRARYHDSNGNVFSSSRDVYNRGTAELQRKAGLRE